MKGSTRKYVDKKMSIMSNEICIYIYIYIYREREIEREREIVTFVVFERQTIEVFGRCSFSIIFNFSENKAFAGKALVLGEICFLILLSLGWTPDPFSLFAVRPTERTSVAQGFVLGGSPWIMHSSKI